MIKKVSSYFRISNLGLSLVVALSYYILVRTGMLFSFQNSSLTPVWPISGIAFAVVLIYGVRIIPGIILGALATDIIVFTGAGVADIYTALWVSVLKTIGITMELLIGCALLKRVPERIIGFERVKAVFEFGLAVLFMCLASATAGPTALCLSGIAQWTAFPSLWLGWWLGNIAGILTITPLIVTAHKYLRGKWQPRRKVEMVLVLVIIFIMGGCIFGDWIDSDPTFLKPYLMLPPLLWAAFRFGQFETLVAIAFAAGVALWQTMNGHGPFAGPGLNESLTSSEVYVSIISLTVLAMRASINEREESEAALQLAHNELASIVNKRTEKLEDYQHRIENIFSAILKYTVLDFSQKVPVSNKGDEIDAIAAGMNTLSEELKIRIQKLQESEERFRLLVESVKDYAIFRVSATGHIASWNAGAQNIKGYSADEIIGKHISVFYNPEEVERGEPEQNLQMARENGRYEREGLRVKKGGKKFWAELVLTALYDNNKNVVGFVEVARDITSRKLAADQLRESEQQLQSIIKNAPDAVIVMDSKSRILKWNPKAEEIFGWSAEEVIDKPFHEFIIPERYREKHKQGIQHFIETGEGPLLNRTIEIQALNKQGKEFSVSLSISSPILVNGDYIFIAFIKDITERKRAESRLKASENFLDSVVENLPNMLFVKDAETLRFVKVNRAGEELLGYSQEDLVGKNDYDFFPKKQADFFIQKDRLVLESGKLEDVSEELVNTKYKGVRTLETKKIPIYDENGKPKYLLGISNDITDRKRTETELKLKSEELTRSNAELEQFAYVASHDLQEPLRMVTSYVQLLEKRYKGKLDEDANEFIAFAVDGSNRMRTLIQSLLEYSRVNRIKPFEKIDLNNLMEIVLHDMRDSIKSTNAIVKVNELPEIVGDHILIGQLFQNLISNALKFKGEKDPEIIISGERKDNEFLFSVKDNGIGINKEYSQKIFVIFQRLHTKDKYPGTGIGLAICKKIVERHGGEIWMDSEPGEGSTFYFTIKTNLKALNA
ncbi:MAG: sensory transduction histidine kinase [Bacteroidetes bacterium]|jgi:PAS domain S-box-containing protein|nr:sensory transduction histidine kinase [Bacteroidota bacterium]